ncbi:MAG: hypothetical protein AB7O37_07905 [Vicinamibacteria bacterium]
MALALILAGSAFFLIQQTTRLPQQALAGARALLEDARSVAAAFRTGSVHTSFAQYASELRGELRLQVATLRQVELFERTDSQAILWGRFALPDVVVEARAPAEYAYSLDLATPWRFERDGAVVRATAPALEAGPPALDVSGLRFEIKQGSVLRDEAAVVESLRLALTELARIRARQSLPLVRETARRQAEQFVESWLRERFSDGGAYVARVYFADETPARP